jgi:hypothetical protein
MNEPRAVRALRTPRESGKALLEPPIDCVAQLLERNAQAPVENVRLLGRSLGDLARSGRAHLLADADAYTRQYRDGIGVRRNADAKVILAGHQPELFHSGVWFKNFVLDRLAREHDAVAVNLVMDNDTCRTASIRVPTGSIDRPVVELVSFDAAGPAMPWEDRAIADAECFYSFADRVARTIEPLVASPLVREMWPDAIAASTRTGRLGTAIAQARHELEGRLGLRTLELPLSTVCNGEAFAWFAAWLLVEARQVRSVYNAAVQTYRAANHVRSAAHPVPDLAIDGEFCESPLWVWSKEDPRRRHLFVAINGDRLALTDRAAWRHEILADAADAPERIAEQLRELAGQGIRIRPRALTNTWYARLVLGDLFVHGIGGAKYDEVTDRIIAGLFGITPPAYLTATATLKLPVEHESDADQQLLELAKRRQALRYHAETMARDSDPEWVAAAERKRSCICEFRAAQSQPWDRETAQRLHAQVTAANAALAPWIAGEMQTLDDQERALKERQRGQQLLGSREHSFCLFPRAAIVPALLALAGG